MAKARKRKTSGNKGKDGGSNTTAIFVIAAIIAMLVIYQVNENPNWSNDLKKITSTQNTSAPKQEKKKETPVATPRTEDVKEKKNTSSAERKKSEKSAINTQDGAVETTKTNENLPVYNEDDNYYYSSSFDFYWPAYTQNDAIVEHSYYTLRYNEKTEQADWVAYKLKKMNLEKSKFKRKDDFRIDPEVKTKSATLDDYKGSGYDRGHLAPAADFGWTKEGMSESFYMSNMSPQHPDFNRGIWSQLEKKVRNWAKNNNEIYVVTGPLFKSKSDKIGKNKVLVPSQYYKVILELNGKEVKGIGFILNNEKSSKPLDTYAMSIDEVEKATGLDFFPSIPDPLENKIEQTYNYSLWE